VPWRLGRKEPQWVHWHPHNRLADKGFEQEEAFGGRPAHRRSLEGNTPTIHALAPMVLGYSSGRVRKLRPALAFPGGHILVSVLLILAVDNEAELAGMLAHSISHVAEGP